MYQRRRERTGTRAERVEEIGEVREGKLDMTEEIAGKADGKRGCEKRRGVRRTYNHRNPEPLNFLKPSGGGPTSRSIR
jgi:hypothetical protein